MLKKQFFVFTEEFFVIFNLVKWILFSGVIGVLVGTATSFFLRFLDMSVSLTYQHSYFYLLLPLIFVFNRFITRTLSPDSTGHGTDKVIEAVHQRAGAIRFRVAPIKFIITTLTLAFGGSVGKEGPCAQVGGAISSSLATFFNFDAKDRKKMVICGISAGFASVFGTPIAGAIFGVEVLFVGRLVYEFLLPALIAGIAGYHISQFLGFHAEFSMLTFQPASSYLLIMKVIVAAIAFGLCSIVFVEMVKWAHVFFKKYDRFWITSSLIGGGVLICIFALSSVPLWGLGIVTISEALNGTVFDLHTGILKTAVTAITLHAGGSGGILTPIFFVGSVVGSSLGALLNSDPAFFACLGFVSLLAGTANTPIAGCLLAIELFGTAVAPYAALSSVISFLLSGYRSVYPAQILSFKKSDISLVNLGENVSSQHPHLTYKSLRLISRSKRFAKRFNQKVRMLLFFI